MNEKLQNCQFFQPNFSFINWESSRNLLIFQFGKFLKFPARNVNNILTLEWYRRVTRAFRLKDRKWRYHLRVKFGKFQKLSILKNPKIVNLENFKNVQFWKFRKFTILQFRKSYNGWTYVKNPNILNLEKSKIFPFKKNPKIVNFENSNNVQFGRF